SKAVREFVAGTEGKLRIFVLPPYAPDTNPDEMSWSQCSSCRVRVA
ncbi:transposase, partial [Frankia sp. Cas3]